jgi:hypothetical protein
VATFSSLRRGRGRADPASAKPNVAMARMAFDDPRAKPEEFPKSRTPAPIDPSLEQVLGRFNTEGLTAQQRQAFAQLSKEQQEKLATFLRYIPTGRKLVIAIVCIWVAMEIVPAIYSLVR